MAVSKQRIGVTVVLLVTVAAILFSAVQYRGKTIRAKILETDRSELLRSCRELIAERHSIGGRTGVLSGSPDAVVLSGQAIVTNERIPSLLRGLTPQSIAVYDNKVVVLVSSIPCNAVIAYSGSTKEWGTMKLTNGLWYYNGSVPK